ncbi:MAG: glycosyltransferase [Chloroflexi bacterium]|nr:glycosyltransferase [Chloroflexota bacterium]
MEKSPENSAQKVSFYLPKLGVGGAERAMLILSAELAKLGFQVDVVLDTSVGDFLSLVAPEIRIIDLKSKSTYTSLPKLIAYLNREKPDVFYSALDLTNLMALIAKRFSRVSTRFVISIQNTVSIHKRALLKKIIERLMLTAIYPWADAVIAVSQGVARDLSEYTRNSVSQIHVIPNPMLSRLFQQPEEDHIHDIWQESGNLSLVLGVGRLEEQKDFPTLLRAFAIVHEEHPSHLIILGEGSQRRSLEMLISDLQIEKYVSLPGIVKNPLKYMENADVFVLSSIWEGLPSVLIEALGVDCPVVSTNCPSGPKEILEGGKYGELVPIRDVQALAKAMLKVLSGDAKKIDDAWLEKYSLEKIMRDNLEVMGFR